MNKGKDVTRGHRTAYTTRMVYGEFCYEWHASDAPPRTSQTTTVNPENPVSVKSKPGPRRSKMERDSGGWVRGMVNGRGLVGYPSP